MVVDERTNEPIEHVFLFNSSRKYSTYTDSNGKANILNFKENDSIFFQHPSYYQTFRLKNKLAGNTKIGLKNKTIQLEEFVLTASRSIENKEFLPYLIDVINTRDLNSNTGYTSADILLPSGNLVVQKTRGGGGSPVLRGFEANKILLVTDGVRMNNSIYRSGHLQNSIEL